MPTPRKRVEPIEAPVFDNPYHTKYRPRNLDEVIGHREIIGSIRSALKSKSRQHTYFLFGPGGTGKTTLARLMAAEFKCSPENLVEIDAASASGIDAMRAVLAGVRYNAFGDSAARAYIVDECHRLSKEAWDSLLKTTEEPPAHVFFFFCSTNPSKVPPAMLTRGPQYVLKPLPNDDIYDLLEDIIKAEDMPTPGRVVDLVVRAAGGSPRQALVMLGKVAHCEDEAEAEKLLEGVGDIKEVIDLCRAIIKGPIRWSEVQKFIKPVEAHGAEGIRIVASRYISAVLMGDNPRNVGFLLDMLKAFSVPCNPNDGLAPILLALGHFADLER